MRSILFIIACMVACVSAAPIFTNLYHFSDELAEFLSRVSKRIDDIHELFDPSMTCNPSSISLPPFASGLPAPTGQEPLYVGLGRGTQNYTCATSSSNSTPKAVGAVARLYNATCVAANYPDLIDLLPAITYRISLPGNSFDAMPPANLGLLGNHFFQGSVPVFDLDTTPSRQLGVAYVKKEADMAAPSTAIKGRNGAVAWLYLKAIEGTIGRYNSVYRVHTAGGSPPKTCEGMPPSFTVEYSANYYFFGN